VIELLLEAERALDAGLLDHAERIYWQAIERDPRNAIAVVGLAQVAIERGDERTGYRFALKALEIDPEDGTARRLARRMAEVIEYRGEPLPVPADQVGRAPADDGRHPGERAEASEPTEAAAPSEALEPGVAAEPTGAEPAAEPAAEPSAGTGAAEAGEAAEPTDAEPAAEPPTPTDDLAPAREPSDADPTPSAERQPADAAVFGSTVGPAPLVVPARHRGLVSRLLRRR
jgi:tetratricopeptide (TPR) repeat protein